MPSIDIKRAHSRPLPEARKLVQRVADHIAQKFDVVSDWDGNTLNFKRSGVDGHIQVSARQIHVTAELGFLLMALRGSVEREIHRYLDEEFG
jgi:putative polyhydroxyalkanoate system protein